MAVTDGLRASLRRVAPATSGRLDESAFLLAGALAGLLGWSGTQILAWVDVPDSAALELMAFLPGWTCTTGADQGRYSTVYNVNDLPDERLVSDVAHGTLTLNADGSFSYQPACRVRAWP